jgi:CHAT domain-containing protein
MKNLCLVILIVFILPLHAQSWKKLQEDASKLCDQGEFLKAIEVSTKALQLAQKDKKIKYEDLLTLKSDVAVYHLLNEQVEKGMELFKPLLEEVEGGRYPGAEINVRQSYGIALGFLGMYTEVIPQLERVLELGKTQPFKATDRVNVIGSLANCYQSLYQYAKAEEMYKEALEICRKEKITNTVDYANILSALALLYKDMQLPEKSLNTFAESEKVFISSGDTLNPQYPVFLSEYATMLADHGQHEKALALLFRVRDIDRRLFTENSNEYATTLNNLGYVYSGMNRIIETEQFYEKCIEIKKNLPYKRVDANYTSMSNLMVFFSKVGRKAEALELAAALEEALMNKQFTDTMKRATFAHNLGVEYFDANQPDKSYKYYKEAIRYYKTLYGPESEKLAELYIDMGTVLQAGQKYTELTENLQKAADYYQKNPKEPHPSGIPTLCNLAFILQRLERPKEAEPIIDQALEVIKKFDVKNVVDIQQTAIIKALIADDLGKVKEAMEYFNKFLESRYGQMERDFSYMTETEKMFFMDEFETVVKNFYTAILNHVDKYPELIRSLLDFRIRTKGFLLNNISKIRQRIIEKNDPQLNEKFEQLRLKRESISKLMSFDTQEYPYALAEATALKAEADQLEKQISMRVSGMGYNNNSTENWMTVQKSLGPGEAAVEVFQSRQLYYNGQGEGTNCTYIILRDKGAPAFVTIDRTLQWEEEVITSYRNSIENKMNEGDLYERLWRKVDDKLQGVHTVYVSPDGIYNQINLNTLFNKQTNKYLLEEKSIHVITSLRDLKQIKQSKPVKPENCVLVGNPKFDYDITKLQSAQPDVSMDVATRGLYGFQLSELPGTKTEVEVIKKTLERNGMRAATFTEINASESALKKLASPDVLHIATHGFFLEDPKEESLNGYTKMEKDFYMNPMMRSGIFLSGANQTYVINTGNVNTLREFEDGMLTAYEAMNLRLDNTELVVLSACQTGLGKVKNGEGVFGLQRAFKLAGAKAIIMSLWPVSDEATKDLMIGFYDEWTRSGNLYEAFRIAQLNVKKKYPQAYYWGAFVLSGK